MKNSQKRWAPIKNWPKLWRNHIGQGGKVWLWLAAAVFVLLAPFLISLAIEPEHQEATLRIAGMSLQLVGFLIALMGIEGSLRFAGAPAVWRDFLNYVAGFAATLKNRTTVLKAEGVVSDTSVGRPLVTTRPGSKVAIEQRILILERNLEHLQKNCLGSKRKI